MMEVRGDLHGYLEGNIPGKLTKQIQRLLVETRGLSRVRKKGEWYETSESIETYKTFKILCLSQGEMERSWRL